MQMVLWMLKDKMIRTTFQKYSSFDCEIIVKIMVSDGFLLITSQESGASCAFPNMRPTLQTPYQQAICFVFRFFYERVQRVSL